MTKVHHANGVHSFAIVVELVTALPVSDRSPANATQRSTHRCCWSRGIVFTESFEIEPTCIRKLKPAHVPTRFDGKK